VEDDRASGYTPLGHGDEMCQLSNTARSSFTLNSALYGSVSQEEKFTGNVSPMSLRAGMKDCGLQNEKQK
jgi:hypothetical protein